MRASPSPSSPASPQEEVAAIRQRTARDDERWKRALVESLFEQAAPLSA